MDLGHPRALDEVVHLAKRSVLREVLQTVL
jgi:hypothetical protein